jgi:hemolysin activation/secretion protein
MSKRTFVYVYAVALIVGGICQNSLAQAEDRFDIGRFAIEGNTLLPAARIEELVAPFSGKQKVFGDVQHALEALENAYHAAGFNTVQVFVPEQELNGGVVRLVVTESVIGKVTVTGNKSFSEANVRASLPALKEGAVPNARVLSENIQLSNENPAKQLEVTLGAGQDAKKIDAKVAVTEEKPQKFYATLDNTGNDASGKYRLGFAYQNANLFDLDHVLTLAYTTSPDKPEGVKVNIYSFAYRLPLYSLGDSIDVVYGNSDVNTPSVQATGFGLAGKGEVTSLRFNHYFPRKGEYSSKLVFGFDYKYFNARCSINGIPQSFDPPTPAIPNCIPYTTRPLSATYSGQWQAAGMLADYYAGISYNFPLGSDYLFPTTGVSDRYSLIANRPADDHFSILRFGGSYTAAVLTDWQARLAFSGQYTNNGLVAGEQFSLAGATAVRGFAERAVVADTGHLVNLEAYSPELATGLKLPGNLRGILFYDFARGHNNDAALATPGSFGIASGGLGLRYNLQKDLILRVDLAEVLKTSQPASENRGDWFGHVNMSYSF